MPATSDHVALADLNGEALNHMRSAGSRFPHWVVTIAFYEAVHRIEAIFANDNVRPRPTTHVEREDLIKRTPKYEKAIYRSYKSLHHASEVARYMKTGAAGFAEFISQENLEQQVLSDWLHKIRSFSQASIEGVRGKA